METVLVLQYNMKSEDWPDNESTRTNPKLKMAST